MNNADCENGFINSIRTDTTRSDTKLQITCIYGKESLESPKKEEKSLSSKEAPPKTQTVKVDWIGIKATIKNGT